MGAVGVQGLRVRICRLGPHALLGDKGVGRPIRSALQRPPRSLLCAQALPRAWLPRAQEDAEEGSEEEAPHGSRGRTLAHPAHTE